jgi:glutaredoxin-related protein
MMKKPIVIYYASICGLCHKAMNAFIERGLDFDARCIGYDKESDAWLPSENLTELEEQIGTFDFVPQMFIYGTHVAGWKKLEPMMESGEFDRLLKKGEESLNDR